MLLEVVLNFLEEEEAERRNDTEYVRKRVPRGTIAECKRGFEKWIREFKAGSSLEEIFHTTVLQEDENGMLDSMRIWELDIIPQSFEELGERKRDLTGTETLAALNKSYLQWKHPYPNWSTGQLVN